MKLPELKMKNYRRAVGVSMCAMLGLFVVPAVGSMMGADSGYTRASAEFTVIQGDNNVSTAEEFVAVFDEANIKGGNYTINLTGDITITESSLRYEMGKRTRGDGKSPILDKSGSTITIIGNGRTINLGQSYTPSGKHSITVQKGTLNFGSLDNKDNKLKILGGDTNGAIYASGGTINMYEGTTLAMTDEKIKFENAENDNTAIGVDITRGAFNMYGGEIKNYISVNPSKWGAGVFIEKEEGVFNMYGGNIHDNIVGGGFPYGGGIVGTYGTINIYGGTIQNNQAIGGKSSGGGICLLLGTLNIHGGQINGNSDNYDRNIYLQSSTLNIESKKDKNVKENKGVIDVSSDELIYIYIYLELMLEKYL